MKKLSLTQWIALGIIATAIIVEIVLVFTHPAAALWAGVAFLLGLAAGYWLKKNNIVNK